MDSLKAFVMGYANRGRGLMVFDWDKAARLIRERGPETAFAGLRGDWEWTGGCIYRDGKPFCKDYTYLSSTWAVPELEIGDELIPCYRMESEVPGWNYDTKWPDSALYILNGKQ